MKPILDTSKVVKNQRLDRFWILVGNFPLIIWFRNINKMTPNEIFLFP